MEFSRTNSLIIDRVEAELLPGITGGRNKVPQVRYIQAKILLENSDICELAVIFEEPVTPQYKIAGYRVFATGLNGPQTTLLGETKNSPFRITIPKVICENKAVSFSVQTVLLNGFSSDVDQAATSALQL